MISRVSEKFSFVFKKLSFIFEKLSFIFKERRVLLCVLLAAAAFFVWRERHFLKENPLEHELRLEAPSWIFTSREGITLIVDKGKRRVSVVRDGEVHGVVEGGRGGFYYAEYAVTDGEKLYIADIRYASLSTSVVTERIMQYSLDGRFEKLLFLRDYSALDDKPLQYGNIRSMQCYEGVLSFVLKNDSSLDIYRFPKADKSTASRSAPDGSARLLRSVAAPPGQKTFAPRHVLYDVSRDVVCAMTLQAVLYVEEDGAFRQAFDWSGNGKNDGIPWAIAADSRGGLFVTDLARRSVAVLPEYKEIFTAQGVVYNLHINENDILSLTDAENVYLLTETGKLLFSGKIFPIEGGRLIFKRLLWVLAAALGGAVLFAAYSLVRRFAYLKSKAQTRLLLIVGFSTVMTSTLIGASIFSVNNRQLEEYHRINLIQLTSALSEVSSLAWGDDLQSIEVLGDYDGEAFARIRSILAPPCDTAASEGAYLYFMVYKYSRDDDELYGVMDYENTLCTVYPMGNLRGSRYGEAALGKIPFFYEHSSDNYGSWAYAVAPVRNSRMEIIGLLEFGYNFFADRLANAQQVRSIVFDTAVLIVLFLLLFSECVAAAGPLFEFQGPVVQGVPELVRPIIFLSYFAVNLDIAFISPLAARIFAASGSSLPISSALSSALPLSASLICCLFSSAAGAKFVERLGTRRALNGGILMTGAGRLFCFWGVARGDYGLLLAGMGLAGAGMGVITLACDAVILFCEEEERNTLFANFNAGILSGVVTGVSIGSYVAKFFGYAAVFAFSAAVVFLVLLFGYRSVPYGIDGEAEIDAPRIPVKKEPEPAVPARRFWMDRDVMSFFSLSMFPFLVIMYYKEYVFPLYADELGYSDITVGQVLLFSGAAAIWLGPPVMEFLLRHLGGKRANVAADALYIAGILVFAVAPSFETAVFVTCVTTAAAGFGLTTQTIYFTNLKPVHHYGHNRAMGAFNAADSLFQSAGPILFGALLPLGYRNACALVGIVGAVFLVLFLLLNRGRNTQELNQDYDALTELDWWIEARR
jgi:predicted MFS family arabinose efflux permease